MVIVFLATRVISRMIVIPYVIGPSRKCLPPRRVAGSLRVIRTTGFVQ
jgi:hypothetical protein